MSVSSVSGPASDAWAQYMQKLKQTQAQVTTPQTQTASTDPTQPATATKAHHGHHHGGAKGAQNTDALAALFDDTTQNDADGLASNATSAGIDILA